MRPVRLLCLATVLLSLAGGAFAQNFTSVVVFGDSLSDTGNIAHLTQANFGVRYPGPLFNYADGRFTDSSSTVPASAAHSGLWVDQLAAVLPTHPSVAASLDGGTDYAYGDATTADGTTTVTETTGVSITLNNMGQQVTDYLAAHPAVPAGTLVVVWGGSNDLALAASATSPQQAQTIITTAVNNELALVQRLIAAGAIDIIVPNLPPLGLVPRFNSNAALSAGVTAAAVAFNSGLLTGLNGIAAAGAGTPLHLHQLDVFTLFNSVVAAPSTYNLTNVAAGAQGQASANADQYLFWDDLHPTTTGHFLVATAALALLTPAATSTTTTVTSSAASSNLDSSVTFTATVTATAGAPAGTVTFADGATALGTGTLSAAGAASSTATFSTSSLSAGTHSITATYGGGAGFAGSTSAAFTQTVTAPDVTASLSPTSVTVKRGNTATTAVTLTPVGGFNGTVQVACGTLPMYAVCTDDAPLGGAYNFSTSSSPQTANITIYTDNRSIATPAAILLPLFGAFTLFVARRRGMRLNLLAAMLVAVSGVGLVGLAGCSDSGKRTPSGTYTVPVSVKPSTGSTTTLNLTLVVQ